MSDEEARKLINKIFNIIQDNEMKKGIVHLCDTDRWCVSGKEVKDAIIEYARITREDVTNDR